MEAIVVPARTVAHIIAAQRSAIGGSRGSHLHQRVTHRRASEAYISILRIVITLRPAFVPEAFTHHLLHHHGNPAILAA